MRRNSPLYERFDQELDSQKSGESRLEKALLAFRRTLFKKEIAHIENKGGFTQTKDEVLRIADLLIDATNQHMLPIELKSISQKMCIHTIREESGLHPFMAELIPDEKGFTMKLKKIDNKVRTRAAFAHEVGHTLFYDTRKLPPIRILCYRPPNAQKDKEEWIAWDFARSLLLPKKFLVREIASTEYPPSPSSIVELARKAEVSVELLCHRIIRDLNIWDPCVLLVLSIENGDLCVETAKIYRTRSFPRFRLKGRNGLIKSSIDFKKIFEPITSSPEKSNSGFVEFQGVPLWIKLFRYSVDPCKILGLLEIPFMSMWENLFSNS